MAAPKSQPAILWLQVGGLAMVQGAIGLSWIIYSLYLPQLFDQAGLPKTWVPPLLIFENLLAVVMEPLVGAQSDRMQRWIGTKFPLIALGVILATGLFIGLPVLVVTASLNPLIRWVLPLTAVAWALAMTLFRSPVLAFLGKYAFASNLPQAASILTLVGAVAGTMGSFANQWILSWGPIVAFGTGSLVLLLAVLVLRLVDARVPASPATKAALLEGVSLPRLGLIFGAGIGITLGSALMRLLLNSPGGTVAGNNLLLTFTIAHLLTIVPAGWVASKTGALKAMLLGSVGAGLALLGVGLTFSAWPSLVAIVLLGASISLVFNGTIPFALILVPPTRAGLGTGLYFGGAALAGSLFGSAQPLVRGLPAIALALLGMAGFLLATGCIGIARYQKLHQKPA